MDFGPMDARMFGMIGGGGGRRIRGMGGGMGPGTPLLNPMLAGGGMPLRGMPMERTDFRMPGNPLHMFDGRPIGPMSLGGMGRLPGLGTGMGPMGGGLRGLGELGGLGGLGRPMMPGPLGLGAMGDRGMGMPMSMLGGMGMLGGGGGMGLDRFGIPPYWMDMMDDDEWDDMDEFEDPDFYLAQIRRDYRRREKLMRRWGRQQLF